MTPPLYTVRDWYWIIGGDETQAYSSAAGAIVPIEQAVFQRMSHIATMDDLTAMLRAANVPPYHAVSSYRIVRRLEEAGAAETALQVIDAPENAVLKARFYTLGAIPADDPDAIALIAAAGADPAAILAPD